MRAVAVMPATKPDAILPRKIDKVVFTATLPNKSVASSKLPFFRMGYITSAYLSPCLALRASDCVSSESSPSVKPEKSPDKSTRTKDIKYSIYYINL